ncbi:AmmeMemoRadiSam system protein A [Candidatus Woesearchaeota archaeon]|nr:AmmeMemoRadiSam system protein A [Candidatus Woesearchaeota archaeon]
MMKELLKLARETIESYFSRKELKISDEIKKKYSDKKACFVTLTKNNQLRGCIGSLQPKQELYKDVIDNAHNAAFQDPRFSPLEKSELEKIKIEISVLSIPKKMIFKDSNDLLNKLTKKEGVIIKKGFYSATYLPQVWKEVNGKEEFLSSLCVKAGLNEDAWKDKIEVFTYHVEIVKE